MTLMRFRTLAVQSGVIGRTLLVLAVVGGVLIGLLAMHTISSASSEHMATASVMTADMSHPGSHGGMVAPSQAESPAECSGMCDPGHIMANMACVLAVLFSVLVFAITASRRWSAFSAALRSRWLAILAVAVEAMPPPPDLNALSISRT